MQALVYDVHGNLPALEAVLQDAGDVDRFILGGDYALFGGWPLETIERLRELPRALDPRQRRALDGATRATRPTTRSLAGAIEAAARARSATQLVADLAVAAGQRGRARHADLPRLARLRRPLVLPRAGRRRGRAARRRRPRRG